MGWNKNEFNEFEATKNQIESGKRRFISGNGRQVSFATFHNDDSMGPKFVRDIQRVYMSSLEGDYILEINQEYKDNRDSSLVKFEIGLFVAGGSEVGVQDLYEDVVLVFEKSGAKRYSVPSIDARQVSLEKREI